MIATALGMSITKIFAKLGEEEFREEESRALEKLDVQQPSIIVTGGGVVLRPRNVARLHELGTVVCLTANLSTLLKRLGRRSHRPLLETENRAETVQTCCENANRSMSRPPILQSTPPRSATTR